jgi:hypothetical protein
MVSGERVALWVSRVQYLPFLSIVWIIADACLLCDSVSSS